MSSGDYTLEDEAALLQWAGKVARVDRRELTAWVVNTINIGPNSRAEKQRRYQLAELFMVVFNRQLEKTPDDAALLTVIGKLANIMAEGDGQQEPTIAPYVTLEL
jgi:hypothetical protein